MATFNISRDLNTVFNTEGSITINSALRDTSLYPAPNSFRVQLPKTLGALKELILTHFVPAGVVPGFVLEIFIDEVMAINSQSTGGVVTCCPNWLVPVAFLPYVSQSKFNDVSVFAKMRAPDVSTLTISIRDQNGALVVGMPDFVMRLYTRSWW